MRLFGLLLGLVLALPLCAEQVQFKAPAPLSLSVLQETEAAIDRALFWLKKESVQTNDLAQMWLYDYAKKSEKDPVFTLRKCTLVPVQETMPHEIEVTITAENFDAVLAEHLQNPKSLYALQRDVPAGFELVRPDWRETLALALVNSQKRGPASHPGGYWIDRDQTVWAILTLRSIAGLACQVHIE